MANELHLDILGTSFSITVDEDEVYLQKVLAKYRAAVENTQSISGMSKPLNVAVLTGFLLCDEITRINEQFEGTSLEVEQRALNLIARLDQALKICSDE